MPSQCLPSLSGEELVPAAMPWMPALPKKGRKVLSPLSADQVEKILAVASPSQRVAFALAAYAGLRAGEVRALR